MFGFPTIQRSTNHRFKNNLLTSVIFQIKFPLNSKILIKKTFLKDKLLDIYPNCKDIVKQKGQMNFPPKGTPILMSYSSSNAGFEFHSHDGHRVLAITDNSITLSIFGKAYTNVQDVLNEFESKYIPIIRELDIDILERIAIRKINMLEVHSDGHSQNYQNLLGSIYNQSLISNIQVMPEGTLIERGLSYITLVTHENEGHQLNLSYGLMEKSPQNANVRQFTYDIDVFKFGKDIKTNALIDDFKKINTEIYNIFIWGINPDVIEKLTGGDYEN